MKNKRQDLTLVVVRHYGTEISNETRWILKDPVTQREYEYWTRSFRPLVVGTTYNFTAEVKIDPGRGVYFFKNPRGFKEVMHETLYGGGAK